MVGLDTTRPAWIEVDLDIIDSNIRAVRRRLQPGTKIMAVVKGNGYGYGAVITAKQAVSSGCEYLAVAIMDEALELRNAGVTTPVLVLGFTPPEQAETLVANDITQTVYLPEMAEAISRAAVNLGKTAKVHIKVDSGMGRIGLGDAAAVVAFARQISSLPGLVVEGIFTHFAVAEMEEKGDREYTEQQIAFFRQVIGALAAAGFRIPLRHAANSAAILTAPQSHFDMVRTGAGVFGTTITHSINREFGLRLALSLKARVVHSKTLPSGKDISYGRTYRTDKDTIVATLPIGYADGYSRMLSNKGEVLIGGRRAPIIGRVCMDQCMVDVGQTGIPVRIGSEAVLIGSQGGETITVDDLATLICPGNLDVEITSLLSRRLPRLYMKGGEVVAVSDLHGLREIKRFC